MKLAQVADDLGFKDIKLVKERFDMLVPDKSPFAQAAVAAMLRRRSIAARTKGAA